MDQPSRWIVFALVAAGVLAVACILLALLAGALSWRVTDTSVHHMRGDWMEGLCPWCEGGGVQTPWGSVAGVVTVLFVAALPLGLIALLILGGAWLVRSARSTPSPSGASLICPSCGAKVEPNWKTCPHCSEKLSG